MWLDARVAVIVPAYNESRLIRSTLAGIPDIVDRIIVVDDASTDDTAAAASQLMDKRIRVVRHTHNRGVGAAIVTGYRAAFTETMDVAAVMAGDGQMDPEDLVRIIEPIVTGRADYCKGDRLSHPDVFGTMPFQRFIANHVFTIMTRLATGLPIRDSQCGYTALSRRAVGVLELERIWPRYGYPNDMLARLAEAKLRVAEVTVRPIYASEVSKITYRDGLIVVPLLIARIALDRVSRMVGVPRALRR